MNALLLDCRHVLRLFAKNRSFVAISVSVLAIGIAVNTAMFTVVSSVLFGRMNVAEPQTLRFVTTVADDGRVKDGISFQDYLVLKTARAVFRDVLLRAGDTALMRFEHDLEDESVEGEMVSANYFDMLGVSPGLGRAFGGRTDDAWASSEPVVALSYALWQRRFGGRSDVLGQRVMLDGRDYTVVAVMAPEFTGTLAPWKRTAYWVPLTQRAQDYECDLPRFLDSGMFVGIGRLASTSTDAEATAALRSVIGQLRDRSRSDHPDWSLIVSSFEPGSISIGPSARTLPTRLAAGLFAVSGLVLLVAVANLAGILLAQGATRRTELTIRLSLGAPRWRLMRQLWLEALCLAIVASAAAIPLAQAFISLFVALVGGSAHTNLSGSSGLNLSSLGIAVALAVATAAAVGVLPILEAPRTHLARLLLGDVATSPRTVTLRMRYLVVVPQVAACLSLLLGAGVFLKTVLRAEIVGLGYRSETVSFVRLDLPLQGQCTRSPASTAAFIEERRDFNRRLIDAVTAAPNVSTTSLTSGLPLDPSTASVTARRGGENQFLRATSLSVSPGYFATVGIPLLQGRDFSSHDSRTSTAVGILSQSMVRQLWPEGDPIGQYFAFNPLSTRGISKWILVVGVVADVAHPLGDGEPRPAVYVPLTQGTYGRTLVATGHADAATIINTLKQIVRDAHPKARIIRSGTLDTEIAAMLMPRRMAAVALLVSGIVAAMLAAAGLYGVVSYAVAQRVREMGIRSALGAQRGQILRLLMGDGLKILLVGLAAGLLSTIVLLRIVSSTLLPVAAFDLLTFVVVVCVLVPSVLAGCYWQARRAANANPIDALRAL